MMEGAAAASGMPTEEIEKRRQERMKRFGEAEVQEALKSSLYSNK